MIRTKTWAFATIVVRSALNRTRTFEFATIAVRLILTILTKRELSPQLVETTVLNYFRKGRRNLIVDLPVVRHKW